MADTLQEFLVELGFTTKGQEKFLSTIKRGERATINLGKTVGKVGAVISAAGIAALKDTKDYARAIEQLGFVAQRTGTTLRNLQAIQLADASLGSSAAGAQASIEGLASFMRRNPGSSAFLSSLGVQTKDLNGHALDTVQIMEGLSDRFQKMKASGPMGEAIALRYADMLGIGENTALAMMSPKFNRRIEGYAKAEGPGVNKAYTSAHKLRNQERTLDAHLFGATARAEVPAMNAMTAALQLANKELGDTNGWLSKLAGLWSTYGGGIEAGGATAGGLWALKKLGARAGAPAAAEAAAAADAAAGADAAAATGGAAAAAGGIAVAPLVVGAGLLAYSPGLNSGEERELKERYARTIFPSLEKSHDLPRGLLDAVWWKESDRGLHLKSPAGALGDFQFMPATARHYGLKNPMDFPASASAAATMYGDLLHEYGGSLHKALAAYNWGSGNLNRDIAKHGADWLQFAPEETQRYVRLIQARMDGVALPNADRFAAGRTEGRLRADPNVSVTQNVNTTINVAGTSDPKLTAQEVARAQKHVNQQLSRNTAGAFR